MSWGAAESERIRFVAWLKSSPAKAGILPSLPAAMSKIVGVMKAQATTEPIRPVMAKSKPVTPAKPSPAPTPSPKPTIPLKSVEDRLRSVVVQAQESILGQVREMLNTHLTQIQELVIGSHDSLMGYWDPEHLKKVLLPPEFVETPSRYQALMDARKPRCRRVLVAASNSRQLLDVQKSFRNVEFSFVNGESPRGAKGKYDLVVCTRFCTHSAWNALKSLHGDNVVFVHGSKSDVVNAVKEKFGI